MNKDAPKIEAKYSSTIGLVCRDNFGHVQHIDGKVTSDCPILVVNSDDSWGSCHQF